MNYPNFHNRGRPVKDAAVLARFAAAVPYCQCCGRRRGGKCWWAGRVQLQIHHLAKAGRSDEDCNLLMVCALCHGLCHGLTVRQGGVLLPSLQDFAVQLWLKAARDPARHDARRLRELLGRPLPEPAQAPFYFEALWLLHRGK